MKKICIVKENFTKTDGVVRVVEMLSKELASEYEVHLVSICGDVEKMTACFAPGVRFTVIKEGNLQIRDTMIAGVKGLRKYVKANQIRIVMAVGASCLIPVVFGCMGLAVKTVYCEHINLFAAMKDRKDFLLRRIFAGRVDKIVTLTEQDRACYLKRFPRLSAKNVVCIYNWTDERLLDIPADYRENTKRIITVGRLCPQKGLEDLTEVAAAVLRKHPDWSWDIYGDGPDRKKIQSKAESLNLKGRLNLRGRENNIYSRYKEYSIYAMTSKYEGLPMVLLEAKAQKLPVIAFDCKTGPSEIVRNGIDGYLIPQDDKEQYKAKLLKLMEEPETRKLFSDNAGGNLEKFSREDNMKKWIKLLKQLERNERN